MIASKRNSLGQRKPSDKHGSVLGPRKHGLVSPTAYAGLAAWYDISDAGSLGLSGTNTILVGDKSGNSAENGLVLNGASGNYASVPDSAPVKLTGDLDFRADVAPTSYTGASQRICAKRTGAGALTGYDFFIDSTGALAFYNGSTIYLSTATVAFSAFQRRWVRMTRQSSSGTIRFFTSTDGVTWTQLGADVAAATGALNDPTNALEIGSFNGGSGGFFTGTIYRVRMFSVIDGSTPVFDANFTLAAKLATSFTESSVNGATVTINTSGATGARISGARDLYQGTVGSQPLYGLATRTLTFDGVDDFLKTAAFTLNQPTTVYFVGSQVTWTDNEYIFDGGTADTLILRQLANGGASPRVSLYAGNTACELDTWAVGQKALISSVFNGASSSIRRNADTAVTGNPLTLSAGGFTLGSSASGSSRFSNFTVNEIAIYNTAHTAAQQAQFWQYAKRKWGIAG